MHHLSVAVNILVDAFTYAAMSFCRVIFFRHAVFRKYVVHYLAIMNAECHAS